MKMSLEDLLGNPQDSEFQMAPLIDCVFLLMVYFLMTTELTKSEADLGIQLPGLVKQFQVVKMPDEQIIEISLSNDERAALHKSAAAVQELVDVLNI